MLKNTIPLQKWLIDIQTQYPFYYDLIILSLASLFLGLFNLGNVALRDWDEGYYGTVSQDMYQTGNWLYPTYLGEPFLLKPPLIMWLMTISYHLGGVNEFSSRFPCALIASLSIPLIYIIGKEIFQERSSAVLSACVYLTLLAVMRHGRLAMIDGMINTYFLISLLGIVKYTQSSRWLILVGIGLGLITLSKGTLMLALGFIIFVIVLFAYPIKLFKSPYLWLGLIIGFTPIITWYFLQIQHYGDVFIKVHFLDQNFSRLSTAVEGNQGNIDYYIWELLKYTMPWLLFFPSSLFIILKSYRKRWAKLILIGGIIYFGLISIMRTKLPWYILPLYPFFALSIGQYLGLVWQNKVSFPRWTGWVMMVLGGLSSVGLLYFIQSQSPVILWLMSITLGITLFFSGLKIYHKQTSFLLILISGLYLSLSLFFASSEWVWELNEAFAVKPVAALINKHTPEKTKIYTSFSYSRTSLDFYSDRKVTAVSNEELQELKLSENYLLIEQTDLNQLHLERYIILGEANGFLLILPQISN
ncbi:MAG: ArnT family glycosyltransferase [Microcystaceae cyanobacterium]